MRTTRRRRRPTRRRRRPSRRETPARNSRSPSPRSRRSSPSRGTSRASARRGRSPPTSTGSSRATKLRRTPRTARPPRDRTARTRRSPEAAGGPAGLQAPPKPATIMRPMARLFRRVLSVLSRRGGPAALLALVAAGALSAAGCKTYPYHREPVTTAQILQWSQAKVTPEEIIQRIRDSRTVYIVHARDVKDLLEKGVDERVVDEMLRTRIREAEDYWRYYYYYPYPYAAGP